MLIAVRQVPGVPWFVAAQVPRAEALQPVDDARWAVMWIAALSLIGALTLGLWAANRITRPLGTLHRAAAAINHALDADSVDLALARPAVKVLEGIPERDEIGDLARMVETLMDRLDHTVNSLTLAAAVWERTFNAVADPIFRLDNNWRIVQLNTAAADWLQESAGALVGKRVDTVLFGASPPENWPQHAMLRAADAQREFRWQANTDRGERQTWEFSAITLVGADAKEAGTILVARNITARLHEEE